MSNTFARVGTANMYDSAIRNLSARQNTLVGLQENLTSAKRVVRPSDDPVAAAQAERALTRISRIQSEQRQLDVQRNAIAQGESTLGDAIGLVQQIRTLFVAAGSGTLKPEDRQTYAKQIDSLRDQLTQTINRKDTNGVPLLGALGSALTAFVGPMLTDPDYQFNGLPGQAASTGVNIATSLDGHAALMFDPRRDGIYNAAISNTNPAYPLNGRQFNTTEVQVGNSGQIQLDPTGAPYTYQVQFGAATVQPDGSYDIAYSITSTNPAFTTVNATATGLAPDKAFTLPITITDPGGATLQFDIKGLPTRDNAAGATKLSPAPGDTVSISASPSLMSAIDAGMRGISEAPDSNAAAQAVGQALASIDAGMERLNNMRGYAGELLNRADRISGDQENRSIQLEADRSRAEDLDMVKGISDFQTANIGYEAALKSYAQVQRLSLFNYMS